MVLKIPPDAKVFKSKILPPFFSIFFGVIVLGTIFILIAEDHINLRALLFAYAVGFFYSIFSSYFLSFFSPIALSADGIYAHSFWGIKRFIQWKEIASVKPFRLLNLVWLRLYSNQNTRVVYMMLFVKQEKEFRAIIKRLAPADSPVLTRLKTG